jgi:hypothetical protein
MKRTVLIFLVIILTAVNQPLRAQDAPPWPAKSSYITGYASTLFLLASPINIGYEYYAHPGWIHPGFSVGWTALFLEAGAYAVTGPHATFSMFTGKKNHHFDLKTGFSYTPILLYSNNKWNDYAVKFMPVVTLGYRYQKPGGNSFFRVGVGIGGLGIGFGIRL